MNDAIFKLVNLNLTVTIDAKARQWATENYVSLEACAWEFALKHRAGQRPFVPSAGRIVVEPYKPPYLTNSDNPKTRWPLRPGDPGYEALKELEKQEAAAIPSAPPPGPPPGPPISPPTPPLSKPAAAIPSAPAAECVTEADKVKRAKAAGDVAAEKGKRAARRAEAREAAAPVGRELV